MVAITNIIFIFRLPPATVAIYAIATVQSLGKKPIYRVLV